MGLTGGGGQIGQNDQKLHEIRKSAFWGQNSRGRNGGDKPILGIVAGFLQFPKP